MLLKTRIFELYKRKYANVSELAQAMGMSVSQIYRVQQGKCDLKQEFIIGAIQALTDNEFTNLAVFA